MEKRQLPYRAEYAKSGRSTCKSCKEQIEKDSLRIAVMVKSHRFDGMQPNWHHHSCFLKKFKPNNVTDIEQFETLRWNDQESIRKTLASAMEPDISGSGKLSKKRRKLETIGVPDLGDYTVEYAKSKRSKCRVCEDFIDKNEVRISKKDYENEIAMQYGPTERWHHVDCFVKARKELKFFGSASILPGFKSLSRDDQEILKTKIPEIERKDLTNGPSPSKKPKQDRINTDLLKKQNETMFAYQDELQKITKQELITLLEFNNQEIPEGISRMLERLSDAMTFGALKKCEKCGGQLTFYSGVGYQCLGYVTEWSKCEAIYKNPARVQFKVPSDMKKKHPFLKTFKGKVSERVFNQNLLPQEASGLELCTENKSVLDTLKFFVHKTDNKVSGNIKKKVESLGGVIAKKWDDEVLAVVSTSAELQKSKLSKNLKIAKDLDIYVLPENFFDDITVSTSKDELIAKLNERKISPWGADPSDKIQEKCAPTSKSVYPSKSVTSRNKSQMFKSNKTVKKITVKDGLAVDPDSKLEKIAHVYRRGNDIFSVVLSLTDVQTDRNSYYRLQILEGDMIKKYWLFRAWGRIGTTIGGNKVEEYSTIDECIGIFENLFEEKTGNKWDMRKNFKKMPGKMMLLDVQYDDSKQEEDIKRDPKLDSKFLSKSVQDLITLIFDVEAMKKTMKEFELDLNKMPLGKLSQTQIHEAFAVLSELQNLINSEGENHRIIAKTNMFYTLVPHDFGISTPPLLNSEDMIKQKVDILNSLMDIEIAYTMLQECHESENALDEYYKKLNADITDLDQDSEEFKIIERYVKNTHAKTHMNYSLEIRNIFKVDRKGEDKKFKKFSKLPNRKLLWHGSRVTNFAGILSQGLRIAPPEAPSTGYMFGKGIYFADMVSKSANYCNTSKKNPTGLLLLCQVALGEMLELTQAEYREKPPPGKNSVKGIGKTHPDPSEKIVLPTGVEVPLGKGVDAQIKNSALLYNEYIVYNESQVKIQYLLKLEFKYKR